MLGKYSWREFLEQTEITSFVLESRRRSAPHSLLPSASRAAESRRIPGRGSAPPAADLDWLPGAGRWPVRRGGVVPGRGSGLPAPASRWAIAQVPGGGRATLRAPGGCCLLSSEPGVQGGHGHGHCGSSKTRLLPSPSAPPAARLPDGEGRLWLPAEEAREPGAPGRPGAPSRSGIGPGSWAQGLGRQGDSSIGLKWAAVVGEVGLLGCAKCAQAGGERGEVRGPREAGVGVVSGSSSVQPR